MIKEYWNKLRGSIRSVKDEIVEAGVVKLFLIACLLFLLALPFLLLRELLLMPIYHAICMIFDMNDLGLKESYKKHFLPEKYKKEQSEKRAKERKKWEEPLLPEGMRKQFKDRSDWHDAYAVDGKAIYAAEGRTLLYVDERVEEFDVPEGVENVYHRCFADCSVLKRISLPSTLKRIGKRAFDSCVSLKEIVVPESVYVLDEEMFVNCSSLEHVVLSSQTIEIPTRMFMNCRSLKYFSLPSKTKTIHIEAFRRCYSLEHIDTNNQLELIKERAFEDCHSLKEFIMPETVKNLQLAMFNGCHSLQHLHFSSQIKDFGGSCCRDCWSINQITMSPMNEEEKEHYRKRWEDYSDEIDITKSECPCPESLFWTKGDSLYFGIPRLTSVCLIFCFTKEEEYTIPSFVTNVKRDAFTSCPNLRTLRLSPYILTSSDPWETNKISYGFIYEYWPKVKDVIFDENLRNTKYAFGLTA